MAFMGLTLGMVIALVVGVIGVVALPLGFFSLASPSVLVLIGFFVVVAIALYKNANPKTLVFFMMIGVVLWLLVSVVPNLMPTSLSFKEDSERSSSMNPLAWVGWEYRLDEYGLDDALVMCETDIVDLPRDFTKISNLHCRLKHEGQEHVAYQVWFDGELPKDWSDTLKQQHIASFHDEQVRLSLKHGYCSENPNSFVKYNGVGACASDYDGEMFEMPIGKHYPEYQYYEHTFVKRTTNNFISIWRSFTSWIGGLFNV